MDFKAIQLYDKSRIEPFLKRESACISELTFTNLWMWQKVHGFSYAIWDGALFILSKSPSQKPYAFYPVSPKEVSTERLMDWVFHLNSYFNHLNHPLVFKKLTAHQKERLSGLHGASFQIVSDRDHYDYLYNSLDLIHLYGKKYDAKRNHIHKFKRLYDFEYVPMNASHVHACKNINDMWCNTLKCKDNESLFLEKEASTLLLDHFEKLDLVGGLLKVDGRYEAYSIGEVLNQNTAVVHIEKANIALSGIYQMMNQQFCQYAFSSLEYINREQDLGLEGLRKAKLSYHPKMLLEKYTAVLL
jgi:uncharacterized protein